MDANPTYNQQSHECTKKSVVRLIIGKIDVAIPFKVGVKQGDSMEPVLFLFIIIAFTESLEQEWTKITYTSSNSDNMTTHHVRPAE